MAASVSSALARMHRSSAPDAIDADLESLWGEAAAPGAVARALMANLVVFCEHRRGERVDFEAPLTSVPLDEVVRRHPSRALILHHSPSDTTAAGTPVAAAVTIVTFGSGGARYGVEEIAVRSACPEASLPSIVRNLTRGDVPTSIWWTEDLSRTPPLGALMDMGRQLLYDSRTWRDVRQGIRALAPLVRDPGVVDLADLNWRRLTAIRHALVHAAKSIAAGRFTAADVRVLHRPGEGALAWLIAGWLASRLPPPLEPASTADFPVRVEERRHGDEILCDRGRRRRRRDRGSDESSAHHRVDRRRRAAFPYGRAARVRRRRRCRRVDVVARGHVPARYDGDACAALLGSVAANHCSRALVNEHRFQLVHFRLDFVEHRTIDAHLTCGCLSDLDRAVCTRRVRRGARVGFASIASASLSPSDRSRSPESDRAAPSRRWARSARAGSPGGGRRRLPDRRLHGRRSPRRGRLGGRRPGGRCLLGCRGLLGRWRLRRRRLVAGGGCVAGGCAAGGGCVAGGC